MALRVSEIAEEGGTTLKIDGRLSGSEVLELTRAGASCTGPLALDLSGLVFADDEGLDAIRDLQARGAQLRNVPRYISLLLELERGPLLPVLGRGA